MKRNIYIDFENVSNIKLEELENTKVFLFIGQNQNRLSTNIVRSIQPLGKNVEWIQISGTGKNALDFHIAYYLAIYKDQSDTEHYIISKDAGFDPLIGHANSLGQKVRRVVSFADVFEKIGLGKELVDKYSRIKGLLAKQQKTKRPKSRKTLASFIETSFQKRINSTEVNKLIENLFREGFMEEKSKRISYLD
jgi:hypothetical protein